MRSFPVCIITILFSFTAAKAETLDHAVERFLAGETITKDILRSITDMRWPQPAGEGNHNHGSTYLYQVKRAIVSPVDLAEWPLHSYLLWDERQQAKTYRELKAIYQKDKNPVTAYAMVCPAMYVDDMELLPELIAKISENKPLRELFDKFYGTRWKPLLDPDF